jgi:ABC-type antimicrobial peptide transport system permease subunit
VVRAPLDAAALSGAIRKAVHEVSAGAAVTFRPMDALLAGATARQRFALQVMAAFALLALLLAAIGIYGVLSYTVAANRCAIGIRMALGARPVDVVRLFVTRAFALVALGAALGVGACLAAGELLRKVVFEINPGDPLVLTAAALTMTIAAIAAAAVPARRAARIDPLTTLRDS